MDKTAVTPPTTEEISQLRQQLANIQNKIMLLGQTTLTLYTEGELTHDDLTPMCEELLALEQALLPPPPAIPDPITPDKTIITDALDDETLIVPLPDELKQLATPAPSPTEQSSSDVSPDLNKTLVINTPSDWPTQAQQTQQAAQKQEAGAANTGQITCPSCRNDIPTGNKFCIVCGYALSNTAPPPPIPEPIKADPAPFKPNNACPRCREPLVADSRFCTNCGEPITPDMITPPPIHETAETIVIPTEGMPITKYCQNCGRGVTAVTITCPDCNGTNFGSL